MIHIKQTCSSLIVLAVLAVLAVPQTAEGAAIIVPENTWVRASSVTDDVTDNGDGTWLYEFTVHNDSRPATNVDPMEDWVDGRPVIYDWELPYFPDAEISDVMSPDYWAAVVETIGSPNGGTGWQGVASWQDPSDPFYAGPTSPFTTADKVLHWYNNGFGEVPNLIEPGEWLSGFEFTSTANTR